MRLSVSLLVVLLLILFDQLNWCEGSDIFHHHDKFGHHLFHFLYKHKKYLKKKGLAVGTAALAAAATNRKKYLPVPFPLPIPIVHQPVIHDPCLTGGPIVCKHLLIHSKLVHLAHLKGGHLGQFGGGIGGVGLLGGGLGGGLGYG